MISYKEALDIIKQAVMPLAAINIKTEAVAGHICAEEVICNVTVPPFNNSAMDGFAVKAELLENVSADNIIKLDVIGSTFAGDNPQPKSQGNCAWEIMTGATVPDGYNAVVIIEDVEILNKNSKGRPTKIKLNKPVRPYSNIRNAGEDFKPGEIVVSAGTLLQAHHAMVLVSLGVANIKVKQTPTVAVLSTGKELVDDISQPLGAGQIRNSNAPYLISVLTALNTNVSYAGTIHDDQEFFEKQLQRLLTENVDIIVSTGAVSMGRHDFIPESLEKLGAEILFHKVSIRPGKPVLFARFDNGSVYFGLPGNPISAAVGARFFVYPSLRYMFGLLDEKPLYANLMSSDKKKPGFRFFRKARALMDDSGSWNVEILPGQESFKMHPLLNANCWAIIEEELATADENQLLQIYPHLPNQLPLNY